MLRVGLTGGLASGKSTAGAMLAAHGAYLLQADEIARELMQPGQAVFREIVRQFGSEVVTADGTLHRPALAHLAFARGRLEELNALVHPATIARQAELAAEIGSAQPDAIVVVESALLFETAHAGPEGWRGRFDRVVLVTAPEPVKVARFAARSGVGDLTGLETEARRRLAAQLPDDRKIVMSDYVLVNNGDLPALQHLVDRLWEELVAYRNSISE